MKPLRLCVHGAGGRAGALVVGCLSETEDFQLTGALVRPQSALLGKQCSAEVRYGCDFEAALRQADIVIDFSSAAASVALAQACAAAGCALLVGTTGHSAEQREAITAAGALIPVALVPNTSLGMAALKNAALETLRRIGAACEIEISETHHSKKLDAPSGSALWLARALAEAADLKVNAERRGARQPREIGISSLRGGDTVGEHTVHFFMPGEQLEISHRVSDRKIFARGALILGRKLCARSKGFYDLDALLG